jgi:hypothetical protein
VAPLGVTSPREGEGYYTMDDSAAFYRAMAAFCRQHAKLQEESERFWLREAQTWAELLKAKNAFWHEFADSQSFLDSIPREREAFDNT